jgi:shikimate 5-dehydrogenase
MKKFYSISQYPGNTGKYFYSNFFKFYNFDAEYIPLGSSNVRQTLHETLPLASGISISMPFKQEVIELIDIKSNSVIEYNSCNTLKIQSNAIHGYNCDLNGVIELCKYFDANDEITILGNGCMANMFKKYINQDHITQYAKSLKNWDNRHKSANVIINCTSLGTSEKTSPLEFIPNKTKMIIDLSISDNNLKKLCYENNIIYFGGITFYKAQFLKQFEIYTDIIADADFFDYINTKK